MADYIAWMVFAGGCGVAYPSLRGEGCGPVKALLYTLAWPALLGMTVARWVDAENEAD